MLQYHIMHVCIAIIVHTRVSLCYICVDAYVHNVCVCVCVCVCVWYIIMSNIYNILRAYL